ncbi:MAG TPA: beta-ketoacyl-ACP synthase III [Abditibacterium sp.]|jgi:3-oxoacyl-[acyl-carrier-protein] synthase-3
MDTLLPHSPASVSELVSERAASHSPVAAPISTSVPAGILGLGHFAPAKILTNFDLEKIVETSDEWIRSRTGIAQRHIANEGESTADIAHQAALNALEDAKISASEIDLIIVATCTPDFQFPATAALVQDKLGANCAAFDLEAACSGFVYGLVVASQFIASGAMRNVLVIGAEVMSRVVDWNDRNTAVLFGDGAGAAVVSAVPSEFGLLGFDLGANGAGGPLLKCATRPDAGESGKVFQNGREVYKFAVHAMGESAVRALDKCGLSGDDVDLLVPHQANIRIIESAAKRLGMPMEKVFLNLHDYGNTSAASIPIALSEAKSQGHLQRGDTVVVVGFGAGLTWASSVLKWF